jgi:hypothetical protein
MSRRFSAAKEPDCPAIILFPYFYCETSGFFEDEGRRRERVLKFGI